jgi:hypothetical protein
MRATEEQVKRFNEDGNFDELTRSLWSARARRGVTAHDFGQFRSVLNRAIATILTGSNHPRAINHRLSSVLQGTKIDRKLRNRRMSQDGVAEARKFIEMAAREFDGVKKRSVSKKLFKRYRPLLDELYRRKLC